MTHKYPSFTSSLQQGRKLKQLLPPTIVHPPPTKNAFTDQVTQKQVELNYIIKVG